MSSFRGRKTKMVQPRDMPKNFQKFPLSKVQKKQVKGIIAEQQEHKYHQKYLGIGIDNAGTVIDLSDVSQGDTDLRRDGDELMPTSLNVKYAAVAADSTNLMRVIIFRYKPDVQAATIPGLSNILIPNGLAVSPYWFYSVDLREQFNILYDKTHSLATADKNQVFVDTTLKMAKQTVGYTSGSIYGRDHIFLLVLSDSTAATHPSIEFSSRLNFTDS